MSSPNDCIDSINSFGNEWDYFNQSDLQDQEANRIFNDYFDLINLDTLSKSRAFDLGCGSGRWANIAADYVEHLVCIDPSSAINIAKKFVRHTNVSFVQESVFNLSLAPNSFDFGYSLGVLHHTKDPQQALRCCVKLLKSGSPFLLYLYHNFDNAPFYHKYLWKLTNLLRLIICQLPEKYKRRVTDLIATFIYLPFSVVYRILSSFGLNVSELPLSYYKDKSFMTIRTDSRDRFGTPLESRFTKKEIKEMMANSGLTDIKFSASQPYWHAIGYKY